MYKESIRKLDQHRLLWDGNRFKPLCSRRNANSAAGSDKADGVSPDMNHPGKD
jgi:hypothetical protein